MSFSHSVSGILSLQLPRYHYRTKLLPNCSEVAAAAAAQVEGAISQLTLAFPPSKVTKSKARLLKQYAAAADDQQAELWAAAMLLLLRLLDVVVPSSLRRQNVIQYFNNAENHTHTPHRGVNRELVSAEFSSRTHTDGEGQKQDCKVKQKLFQD